MIHPRVGIACRREPLPSSHQKQEEQALRQIRFLAPSILALAFASDIGAATFTVSKTGTYQTIQDGINAAAFGDTVQVKAGVYQENVLIPPGKDGLILTRKGSGEVLIEARQVGGAAGGPGILVRSNGVSISYLTIQNAADDTVNAGDGVYADGVVDVILEKVKIYNCEDGGFRASTGGHKIKECTFAGNSGAVDVVGDGVVVRKSTIRQDGRVGISIDGTGAKIQQNNIFNINVGQAIFVDGNTALIENNVVCGVDEHGIQVAGDSASILENDVSCCRREGISIVGNNGEIADNVVHDTRDYGISANGAFSKINKNTVQRTYNSAVSVVGLDPVFSGNTVSDVYGTQPGIRIAASGVNGVVSANQVSNTTGAGMQLVSGLSTVTDNTATNCGVPDQPGFEVYGLAVQIIGNEATECGEGFRIFATTSSVLSNTATRNLQDGIDIEPGANNNLVRKNVCKRNRAEGVENNGNGTFLDENTAQKNRIDIANSGVLASFQNNVYTTGGDSTAPEID